MAETRYPGTLRSARADKKLAFAENIYDENQNKFQQAINTEVKSRLDDVKDTLTSDSTTTPLSAKQGKNLKQLIDAKVIAAGGVAFDATPTANSSNAVLSGGVYTKIKAIEDKTVYCTEDEYLALVAAGTVDETKDYNIIEE